MAAAAAGTKENYGFAFLLRFRLGQLVRTQVRFDTPFAKMMSKACAMFGADVGKTQFRLHKPDGRILKGNETPRTVGMQSGNIIERMALPSVAFVPSETMSTTVVPENRPCKPRPRKLHLRLLRRQRVFSPKTGCEGKLKGKIQSPNHIGRRKDCLIQGGRATEHRVIGTVQHRCKKNWTLCGRLQCNRLDFLRNVVRSILEGDRWWYSASPEVAAGYIHDVLSKF